MSSVLIIGYGNPIRQDDGIGHYVANKIEQLFDKQIDVFTCHQLEIELVDTIKDYDIVIFIDAQSDRCSPSIQISIIEPVQSLSAFSHFIKPNSLIALTQCLYNKKPKALLVSICGHNFGFGDSISPETQKLGDVAVKEIFNLVEQLTQS